MNEFVDELATRQPDSESDAPAVAGLTASLLALFVEGIAAPDPRREC